MFVPEEDLNYCPQGRTITRDCFATDRERHAAKMRTPEACTRYGRRFHAGETPFGWQNHGSSEQAQRGVAA